jgi:hypothetical protein
MGQFDARGICFALFNRPGLIATPFRRVHCVDESNFSFALITVMMSTTSLLP